MQENTCAGRKGAGRNMIEIIREENSDGTKEQGGLPKDIKQIGKPDIGDRIYVENQVYQYMHPYHGYEEAAYVLLGRFENYAGKQCVFVEAAIRLEEIAFEGEIPVWNDQTWAYIYKQLKHEYDSMVIVGWALDIKGQLPNMTAKIEALHQNNFGGPHQVLFLMDSLEREETFYCSRNGRLYRRDGFYVYYRKSGEWTTDEEETPVREKAAERMAMAANESEEPAKKPEEPSGMTGESAEESMGFAERFLRFGEETDEEPAARGGFFRGKGSYREQMKERQQKGWNMSYAYTGLMVAIVCALGATVYQNYQKLGAMEAAIAEMNKDEDKDAGASAITVETVAGNVEKQETQTAGTDTAVSAGTDGAASTGTDMAAAPAGTDAALSDTETAGAATQTAEAGEQSDTEKEAQADAAETEAPAGAGTQAAADENAGNNEQTADTKTEENTAAEAMTEAQTYLKQGYYIVQKGDSLIGICRKIYQTTAMMEKLCEANNIEDMDAIYAGQYLTLPN